MQGRGFEDAQAAYLADPRKLIGQVRRFGEEGPAYEILALDENGRLVTEVVHSGERVICEVKECLKIPWPKRFHDGTKENKVSLR